MADALDELAGGGVAGDDGGGGDGVVAEIEAEVGLAGIGVAAVAGEAFGGKERADGEVVGDRRYGFRPCGGGEEEGEEGERETWHGATGAIGFQDEATGERMQTARLAVDCGSLG